MVITLDWPTLLTGGLITLSRIADVSAGTVRTISIVHGRTKSAFFLGLLEISLWLFVISTVLGAMSDKPVLGVFYALGFSLGNVVGIKLEKRLAFGHTILRIISRQGQVLADDIRREGFAVTTFKGEGLSGPVTELFIVCRRRDLNSLLKRVHCQEPDAFYTTEHVGSVNKIYRPFMSQATGWRAILKKK
ncbi:MAG: DUF5698 domain-containing protein [Pseudomonadota bacterium]